MPLRTAKAFSRGCKGHLHNSHGAIAIRKGTWQAGQAKTKQAWQPPSPKALAGSTHQAWAVYNPIRTLCPLRETIFKFQADYTGTADREYQH